MKKTAYIFLFVFIFSCKSKEDSLIGKWYNVERQFDGSSHNKKIIEKIANGKIYTFHKNNKLSVLADGIEYEGVYEILKDKNHSILHTVSFNQTQTFDQYFRIYFTDSIKMDKFSLVFIHPENREKHSSGRTDLYNKIK